MFVWENARYLPYIKINELSIDGLEVNLNEKDDWRSLNKIIIKNYQTSINKDWYKLNMNVSIIIDDETGGRSGKEDEKFSLLKEELCKGATLKIYSPSSNNYKSYKLDDFDDSVVSWSGDISISSLMLSENLFLYPSLIGKLSDFGNQFLNLAGGDSFKSEEALIINFDEPSDNLGGKNIKLIKLDFHNPIHKGNNYKNYVPKSVKNETHYINADLDNPEPIIFVNTHIEEVQKLYNDYSKAGGLNKFFVPGKMAITNLGIQAWNLVLSNIISECISEITTETQDDDLAKEINKKIESLNTWYIESLEGVARSLIKDGEEYDQNKVIIKFLSRYIENPDKVNREIAALFNNLLGIKKETVGYANNLEKLSLRGSA